MPKKVVTGKHRYTSDIKREGMLFGKVVRPATFNATLVSSDTKVAEAMPGSKSCHRRKLHRRRGARPTDCDERPVNAIAVDWKSPGQPSNA
jgi:isoquinoline 1-oxidoreductase